MSITETETRTDLVRQAFWLEWLTITWMVIEAAVALWSGYAAHSITLLAFGLDSVIELISAGVLLWRLTVELRRGQAFSEQAEQRASRIGGGLLFALAAYVVLSAAWSLWNRQGENFQWWASYWPLLPFRLCTFSPNEKSTLRQRLAVGLLGRMPLRQLPADGCPVWSWLVSPLNTSSGHGGLMQ
jgi:hypothetical protein